jgi:predicted short-subunit dehydrogenase-like oxidoreductase (DUF2520 family)
MEEPTYGLIGRGRVATHLAHYLELEKQPFSIWHRGMDRPPAEVVGDADLLLLAISDGALEPFLAEHRELASVTAVHFSGSLVVGAAHGLHPLMTFGPELYELETYRSIPFIEEREGLGFREVFPALRNPSWAIDREHKPLYHALCVLAGNFTTLLWSKAFDDFETRLGLPRQALLPYLTRTVNNTTRTGRTALTGPLARGDADTVARDLRALGDDPFEGVYRAFAAAHECQEVTT